MREHLSLADYRLGFLLAVEATRGVMWELGDCLNAFEQADQLPLALCEAPVDASGALFSDELGKQWMQSCIIRACRKLQAAEYHCANIDTEIKRSRELDEHSAQTSGMTHGGIFVFGEKEHIAYELDAFLAGAGAASISSRECSHCIYEE